MFQSQRMIVPRAITDLMCCAFGSWRAQASPPSIDLAPHSLLVIVIVAIISIFYNHKDQLSTIDTRFMTPVWL